MNNSAQGGNNGADWNNAFKSFKDAGLHETKGTGARGHVFFVAGSDTPYGPLALKNGPLGDTYITIRKATAGECGHITGWKQEFGEKQAVFLSTPSASAVYCVVKIYTDNWKIDGVTGTGATGHGIRLKVEECSFKFSYGLMIGAGVKNIECSHCDIAHCGEDQGDLNHSAVYCNSSGTTPAANVRISYCYIHDVNQTHFLLRNIEHWTIEYCYIARRHTDGTLHGQSMSIDDCGDDSNRIHIRHNVFEDLKATGMITYGLDHATTNSDMHVYGNIFTITDSARYGLSDAVIGSLSSNPANDNHVYNNTFVNITLRSGLKATGGIYWDGGTGNVAWNNLFYHCPALRHKNAGNDYNWYYLCGDHSSLTSEPHVQHGTAGAFVNSASNDFRLVRPTHPGRDLAEPYTFDRIGKKRGSDGVWDRGAYEFEKDNGNTTQEAPLSSSGISISRKGNVFFLAFSSGKPADARFAVFDLHGKTIISCSKRLLPGLNTIDFRYRGSKRFLPAGECYLLELATSEWRSFHRILLF